jgi:hypothetical protein
MGPSRGGKEHIHSIAHRRPHRLCCQGERCLVDGHCELLRYKLRLADAREATESGAHHPAPAKVCRQHVVHKVLRVRMSEELSWRLVIGQGDWEES